MTRRSDKPALLFITNRLQGRGVGQLVGTRASWLVRHGYRIKVIAWQLARQLSSRDNPALEMLSAAGVPVEEREMRGRLQLLRRSVRVVETAWRERFPVVVGCGTLGGLVAVLAKQMSLGRLRAVVEVQSNPLAYEREMSPTIVKLTRKLYRRADSILTCSEGLRHRAIDYYRLLSEKCQGVRS